MDLSWSQTPNSVWWALEKSGSTVSLLGDSLTTLPVTPSRMPGSEFAINNFYEYADEPDLGESEEDIVEWMKENPSRGAIRVYQPGFSYSEVVKCTSDTTAGSVMARCFAKELFIHFGLNHQRRVRIEEFPLQLQNRFLHELGHNHLHHIQLEGIRTDLAPLFKFVAGQEKGKRLEDRVQLACALKVKELNGLSVWSKRFCILCGSRMFIFATSRPKGKPTLVLDLTGGSIMEHKSKKHFYCLKITASRKDVLLSFGSRLEQSKWLQRAAKVVSKHPLEANLSGYSLEKVPKYFFLNSNLVGINLAHNYMQERFEYTDAHLLGQPRTIGWMSDLAIFHRLVSLSLSDNDLEYFPVSLCAISTIQELDLSCNKIRVLPQEVQLMTNLTILLLHSNQLTSLPFQLSELKLLSTLVIAFNRFFELPSIVKEMPSLATLVASGNYISSVPDDIHRIPNLQHFDMRLNKIKCSLPDSTAELRNLVRLNLQGNGLPEVNTRRLPFLELLNCSENALRSLEIQEGPMTILFAKNNRITQFTVAPTCDQLTSIDISRNELTSLPDALTELRNLEKLNASNNKLTKLPAGIFLMPQLQLLRASNNRLISLPQAVDRTCILEQLDLHGNQLSSLPPQLLVRTNRLQVLNVSSNQLFSLPSLNPLDELNSVTDLYAANNCLRENALLVIAGYRKLKVLHLAYNEIRTVPSGVFGHLKNLEYLNLSGNSLSSLPPILGCARLRCLLLHSNQLPTLPDLPRLTHLHTLDLACNQLERMPEMDSFPYLHSLDLSGNSSLTFSGKEAKSLRRVSHCFMEGVWDIRSTPVLLGDRMETGGTTKHGKWSYGSAQVIGVKSQVDCTAQLKVSTATEGQDGLFVVMDGGRSPDAPEALKKMLESVMLEELAEDERELKAGFQNPDRLQYLVHTFLTVHRQLGEIGQRYGCSVVLCHFHALKDGTYVLNVANTGLGEAILCRSGRAVPLTTPHSPSTNIKERTRVVDAKGFISQDNRVNGVCGTSRLVGCYHLWPQVLPVPSTESVKLRQGDEYVVIATDGLWKCVTYEQVVHEVQSISDPIRAAKQLRDLAVSHGCSDDVSVLVLRLNIYQRGVPPLLIPKSKPMKPIPEPEGDDDEELEITNIDDILSDTEDDDHQTTPTGITNTNAAISEDLDRLILSAISSSPTSPISPTVKTTNIDDLLAEIPSPAMLESPNPSSFDFSNTSTTTSYAYTSAVQKPSHLSHKSYQLPEELNYPAQTLPRDAAGSRAKGTKSAALSAGGFSITETLFEQTQSVPVLNGPQEGLPDDAGDPVEKNLVLLNRTMSELDEEANPERPRKGAKIVKRLSYVEHSYKQLTNDLYSADSLGHTQNTTDLLDDWLS